MILNGRSSDHHAEARYHCGLAALTGAVAMALLGFFVPNVPYLALVALTLAIVGTMSAIPVFWQMPNLFLAGSAAAAGIALINSIANLAGFGAPYAMGAIKDATGSMSIGLWLVAAFEAITVLLILKFIPAPRRELVQHAEETYGKPKTA